MRLNLSDIRKEIFITLTGAAFIAASVLCMRLSQLEITLLVNSLHNRFLDVFCLIATYLGDGLFALWLSLTLFVFWGRDKGIMVLIGYAISSGLTQLLKRWVFQEMHRPLWHLENLIGTIYYLPPGAEKIYNNSFPSGHTTTAFAILAMLSFFTPKASLKILFFSLAFLTAFTRVYLLQHFLMDTMAGAIIGSLVSYLLFVTLWKQNRLPAYFKN